MPRQQSSASEQPSMASLRKAIKILSLFSRRRPELSLGEIISLSGLPKTTAYRILTTLVEERICDRDPVTGRYGLGVTLLHFGYIRRRTKLVELSLPILRLLRTHIDETVVISVRVGDDRVQLDQVEAHHPLFLQAEPGVRVPLYLGATSLVLLSGLTSLQLESYLARTPMERRQRNEILTPAHLRSEIELIAHRGYAESCSELVQASCTTLAVPLVDQNGNIIAAIGALVADSRYNPQFRARALKLLQDCAQKITMKLASFGGE